MQKSRFINRYILIAAAVLTLVFGPGSGCTAPSTGPTLVPTEPAVNEAYLEVFEVVWRTVDETYFDPEFGGLDWNAVHKEYKPMIAAARDDETFYQILNQMLWLLNVSHTGVGPGDMWRSVEPVAFAPAEIGIDVRLLDGQAVITGVEAGSPAEESGLRPGFVIQGIDGITVKQILSESEDHLAPPYNERGRIDGLTRCLLARIYGEPETSLTLTYLDEHDEIHEQAIARRQRERPAPMVGIPLPAAYLEFTSERVEKGIGVIRFNTFHPDLIPDIVEAVATMQDAPGIIIDLRGNPGGELTTGKRLAGQFLNRETSFGRFIAREETAELVVTGESVYAGPVVVLIDALSYSASEWFASGMQATGRAVVIGERSPGGATAMSVMTLPNGASLGYPVAQILTPDGTVLEGHGVIPDVAVPLDRTQLLEGVDAQLEAAIDYIADVPGSQAPSPPGLTSLEGDYLGQAPPGTTPRIFAPGIISVDANFEHSAAVFSPDNDEVFWCTNVGWYTDERVVGNQRLYYMKIVDGVWTAPQIAPFTENIHVPVQRPVFSPDGSKLYIEYSSDPNHEDDMDIYVVERIGEGWSEPVPVSPLINSPAIERLHCVTADGSLYFSRDPFTEREEIFVSRFVDGAFAEPERLGESYNSDDYEVAILIAPNEEYMLIEQMNAQHTSLKVTISYKKADGSWTDRVRTPYECGGFLALSPDGEYLFFLGEGIYWVNTSFVDELNPLADERIPEAGEATISANTVDQIVQRQRFGGHTDLVYGLAFTSDRFLASGSVDGTVRLWDLTSGQAVHSLRHSGGVCGLAMSPDGTLLASGGLDRSVKLWDLETGQLVHTFSGYEGAVCGLDFSPDGTLLAAGSVDQSVKLWDVAGRQLRHTLTGHTTAVFSVAFAPDGARLASGSARPDLHIKLWDAESGQEVRTLTGQETDVHHLAFSPDGTLLAAVGPMAEAKLWNVASGQVIQDLYGHNGNVFGTAFSSDGSLLASSGDDGTVKLWDVATGRALRTLRPGGEGLAVAFSPDGSLLACTDADNKVHLWGIPPE